MTSIGTARVLDLVGDLADARPPLYVALADRLRLLVGDGRLPIGSRLPAERELAAALHLSRATVAAAYARLRDQGWADARQGAGTWTRLPAGPHRAAGCPRRPAPGVIDLAHAAPAAPPQVPAAFAAALDDLPRLLPGHGYHPQGLPELRARVAERYTERGLPTTAEQVLITSGRAACRGGRCRDGGTPGQPGAGRAPDVPERPGRDPGARRAPGAGQHLGATTPTARSRDLTRAARETAPRRGLPDAGLPQPDRACCSTRPSGGGWRWVSSRRASWPWSTRRSSTSGWTSRPRHRSPAAARRRARSSRWAR